MRCLVARAAEYRALPISDPQAAMSSRASRLCKVRCGRPDQLLAQTIEAGELIDGLPSQQRHRPLDSGQLAIAAPTKPLLQNQPEWNQAVPEPGLHHPHGRAERLHEDEMALEQLPMVLLDQRLDRFPC